MYEHREGWGHGVGERPGSENQAYTPGFVLAVEHLKEKLISQAQEMSRLRSELVSPTMPSNGAEGRRSFRYLSP